MRPEDELVLSFYREIAKLDVDHNIALLEHIETHQLHVKKTLNQFDEGIYRYLKEGNYPHIPKISALIRDGEELIVIEQFINGMTLEQRLEDGLLTEAEAEDIVLQLCGILQPLHEHRPSIVHRDIKPSNLILCDDQLWLVDFDAARDTRKDRRRDTVLMGTEEYAAPEQYGFSQSTERTDIYAIGVLLNRLLTGKFPADEMACGKYGRIIRRCIAMDPKDRYASVDALAKDIRRGGDGQRGSDRKAWLHELPGFRGESPGPKILAAIAYILIVLGIFAIRIDKPDGSEAGLLESMANHIAMLIIVFGNVVYLGNFIGIRDWFPFRKAGNRLLNAGRILLGAAIIFFVPLVVLVLIYP